MRAPPSITNDKSANTAGSACNHSWTQYLHHDAEYLALKQPAPLSVVKDNRGLALIGARHPKTPSRLWDEMPPTRGISCLLLCLYGIREPASAIPRTLSWAVCALKYHHMVSIILTRELLLRGQTTDTWRWLTAVYRWSSAMFRIFKNILAYYIITLWIILGGDWRM